MVKVGLQLRRLWLKNFRSIASAKIEMTNPLVFVGRNGAGKTNIADAFSFVSDAVSFPLTTAFDKRGGIQSVRHRTPGRGRPTNISVRVDIEDDTNRYIKAVYAFEIKSRKDFGFAVGQEKCQLDFADGQNFFFHRSNGSFKCSDSSLIPNVEPTSLLLPILGGDKRLAPLYDFCRSMRTYFIEPFALRETQDPDSGAILQSDGRNAASVLRSLKKREGGKYVIEKISEYLAAVVPGLNTVSERRLGKQLTLQFEQDVSGEPVRYDAYCMSNGTLRVLGILLAVFQKPSPSLLIIEEPEVTIHPGAIDIIVDVLREASRTMQVVITSHSPELLDNKWFQPDSFRIVLWENGETLFSKLGNSSTEAIRTHLMSAGQLMRADALVCSNNAKYSVEHGLFDFPPV